MLYLQAEQDKAVSPSLPPESGENSAWSAIGSWVSRAREAMAQATQNSSGAASQAENLTEPLALEAGRHSNGADDDAPPESSFSSFMRKAGQGIAQGLGNVQESVSRGVDRAKTMEWRDVSDGASSAASSLGERINSGVEQTKSGEAWNSTRESMRNGWKAISDRTTSASTVLSERLAESEMVQSARGTVANAASSTSAGLTSVGQSVSSAALVVTDPQAMRRFFVMFGVGLVLCVVSIYFLPMVFLMPRLFAIIFTLGSASLLGSFVVLRGPAFLYTLIETKRLPFTAAYVIGVLCALWALLFPMKGGSFLAIGGGLCQVVALIYFICSFFPGGVTTLNALRSAGSRTLTRVLDG
mmetsp:Transcript_54921/g.101645  ORF Transcript_54921/g.101645 Transcript_54921/m.101645 type:complete len:356 (-) Transcript_54921:58-1125(-)